MPKQYSGMGLSLLYPDSWTASEEGESESRQGVTLESPGGAFLAINPIHSPATPEEVLQQAAEAMDAEYEDIESESCHMQLAGQEYPGIIQRFYYLDFVVTSKMVILPVEGRQFLIQIQGEDREIDQQSLVFEAILTSMLRSANVAR